MAEAFVNHNPDPLLHLWGRTGPRGREIGGSVALCGVVVRERRGGFDREHPKACPNCLEALDAGYSYEEYSAIRGQRTKQRMESGDFRGFVCREEDIRG